MREYTKQLENYKAIFEKEFGGTWNTVMDNINKMEKRKFIKYLDDILKPYSFKKKASYWYLDNKELIKVIHAQKSDFGNVYYLNYGFIISGLGDTSSDMHVYNRLGSSDTVENSRIMDLLNFEKNIEENQRLSEIEFYIKDVIIKEFQSINTEDDLLKNLKRRPHLNDIRLVVKRHFNLE